MNEQIAEETSLFVFGINSSLNQHLAKLQAHLPPDEFKAIRTDFAHVMAGLLDIVNTIYSQYPQLKPLQLGGPYAIPSSALG